MTTGPDPRSGQVGALSPDGRWRWDGARWVPVVTMAPTRRGPSQRLKWGLIAGAIVVVLFLAAVGSALSQVSPGSHATIDHPCAMLGSSDLSDLVPDVQTDGYGGPNAQCKWTEGDGKDDRSLELDFYCYPSFLFTSAEDRAHQAFLQLHPGGGPGTLRGGIGDESVKQTSTVYSIRTDNVLWTIAAVGGSDGDAPLVDAAARQVDMHLRDTSPI